MAPDIDQLLMRQVPQQLFRCFEQIRSCLCIAFVALCMTSTAMAQPPQDESTWSWIYIAPVPDKWSIKTGKAKVAMDDASISAELFDESHVNFALYRLKGSLKGNRVNVTVESLHSGAGPSRFSGTIAKRTLVGFADYSGVQTIMLSDGWNQIGLTRSLRR